MKSGNQPKVIFLDWYRTLSNSLFWPKSRDSDGESYHFDDILFNNLGHLIGPWMRGQYSSEDICEKISEITSVPSHEILEELKVSCQGMQLVDSNIPKLLTKLRNKGYLVFIATDNMDTFNRWTYPSLIKYDCFDGVINSYNQKSLKMDIENDRSIFFDFFFQTHKLTFSDCMLIDDSEDKDNRLQNLGLDYRQISSPFEVGAILEKLL